MQATEKYLFAEALELVWKKIKKADLLINEKKVWAIVGEEQKEILAELVDLIRQVAVDIEPFMPETAKKIQGQFNSRKIKKAEHLFQRLS